MVLFSACIGLGFDCYACVMFGYLVGVVFGFLGFAFGVWFLEFLVVLLRVWVMAVWFLGFWVSGTSWGWVC